MEKTLRTRIAGAVMAVVFSAGLGTAALASAEPGASAEPPAPQTQTQNAPENAQPRGEMVTEPSGEMSREPSGEMNAQPSGEMNAEPSGEMNQEPSGEPGAEPNLEPSGEMDAPDGDAPQQTPDAKPAENRGLFEDLRSFIEDLMRRIQSLLGMGQTAQQPDAAPAAPQQEQDRDPGAQNAPAENGEPSHEASGEPSSEMGQPSEEMGQASGEPASYSAASVVTESSTGASYVSTSGDENAVLVSGGSVTLTDATVNKTGSSSGDSADFYGVNAAVLATGGATLTIENATVTTDGSHANGVFSYGAGTVLNISDSTITTSANNSGGLMTTGGATLNAANLTVSTSGNSSAAIRSDRGGGTVRVTDGAYAASGVGSPAIYSTADITVTGAALTATSSEAVVIEGGNSVTLIDDAVSGNNVTLNGQSTVKTNVLIYQSMSGDAAEGSSSFTMTGGSMTAGTGAMFHVTNVTTEINLSGVDFTYAADSDVFLSATADAWGTAGKNGGAVTLNLDDQDIVGVITMDSVSSVAVNLTNGSTWTLTGDSYVTSLTGDTSGINLNGHTLYVNGVAWNG